MCIRDSVWGERRAVEAAPAEDRAAEAAPAGDRAADGAADGAAEATPSKAPVRGASAAGAWPTRGGTSSVQSTAFSALGARAQEEAAIAARRLARARAREWQSPRQARLQARGGVESRGRRPRAAYTAARDYWVQREG